MYLGVDIVKTWLQGIRKLRNIWLEYSHLLLLIATTKVISALCQEFDVKGFPTIKFMKPFQGKLDVRGNNR